MARSLCFPIRAAGSFSKQCKIGTSSTPATLVGEVPNGALVAVFAGPVMDSEWAFFHTANKKPKKTAHLIFRNEVAHADHHNLVSTVLLGLGSHLWSLQAESVDHQS